MYFANEHPAYPEGGKMSQHFESLKIGDLVDFKGPLGHFVYNGCGSYTLNGKVRRAAAPTSGIPHAPPLHGNCPPVNC